jgi:hypothetical protein
VYYILPNDPGLLELIPWLVNSEYYDFIKLHYIFHVPKKYDLAGALPFWGILYKLGNIWTQNLLILLQIADWGKSKTEKGSYCSYANYPLIIRKLGQTFNWRLTALIEALQWYLIHENRSIQQKVIAFCRQTPDFGGSGSHLLTNADYRTLEAKMHKQIIIHRFTFAQKDKQFKS